MVEEGDPEVEEPVVVEEERDKGEQVLEAEGRFAEVFKKEEAVDHLVIAG